MSNVAVVVVGDFGRSPRMQYHTLSLAKSGKKVSVVASQGSKPIQEVAEHPNVQLYLMKDVKFQQWPTILRYGLKAVYQTLILLWNLLFVIPKPNSILVQNPPSVPTLPCVWLACKLRRSKFVLDWHNYGYTILRMNVGRDNALVKIYQWIEFFFGAKADDGFCVSEAMKIDLANHGINNVTVLHDKPAEIFQPIDWNNEESLERVHNLLVKLTESGLKDLSSSSDETVLTIRQNGRIVLKSRDQRPLLLLSSTSWTEDEDFGLLLAALEKFDKAASAETPPILCIVTGKGPQKEFYLEKISHLELNKVKILTPWLDIQDYPVVVSMADLGVSLHKSSSSLDLPTKIVDMFGCCVPVLAWKYRCIVELVRPNETGLLFESSDELSRHLLKLIDLRSQETLSAWRNSIEQWQRLRWDRNWNNLADSIFS